jgi:hypothetical protein
MSKALKKEILLEEKRSGKNSFGREERSEETHLDGYLAGSELGNGYNYWDKMIPFKMLQ